MDNFRFAITALGTNKLRSFLTMLGIIIGVAAVVTLVSIGQGVSSFVTGQFAGLGNNLLFVFPGEGIGPDSNQPRRRPGGAGLTNRDVEALSDPLRTPSVLRIVPVYERPAIVTGESEQTRTTITGTTADFSLARNFNPVLGSFISAQDEAAGARVAVLGQAPYATLFPDGRDPIGETIRINDVLFTVIGVLEDKGSSGFNDQNDLIVVPISTAQQRLFNARRSDGSLRVDYILAETVNEEIQNTAITEIEIVLREVHRIGFDEEDDFSVVSQAELVSAFAQVTDILTIFLGVIAGISLLVGGIGIMNIMLVSVTERTREIGLRKATGAQRRDILWQFLTEAVLLATIGGAIGLVLALVGIFGIAALSPDLAPALDINAVLLALSFSAGVGLLFGVYPATRAAALNPIEALRYE